MSAPTNQPTPPIVAPPAAAAQAEQDPRERSAVGEAWAEIVHGSPSWLTSLALHMVVVILLALWSLPSLPELSKNLLLSEPSTEDENLDDFEEINLDQAELESEPVEFELQPEIEELAEEVSLSTFEDLTAAPTFTELSDVGLTPAAPSIPNDALGFSGVGTTGRGKMSLAAIAKAGGSAESEEAIENALRWIAEHQNPDGSWTLVHTAGPCQGRCPNPSNRGAAESLRAGTGLALLPFLGAGQTHKDGKYKRVVNRGLEAMARLAKNEDQGASWRDPGGAGAYSHGISAIALSEAYGMTGDSVLGSLAQAAVDHIIASQGADGGWRYRPRDPLGDTSVVGWQVMALKSAYLAHLQVPPVTVAGASQFLNTVARANGTEYTYLASDNATSPTRSSIGLLCRMYLGWNRENESLREGALKIAAVGPSENNYYYNYYASQVLFQYTGGKGAVWRKWNTDLREQLISQQATTGHAKGSWYVDGQHNDSGGRLYMTSLATMTLEVYYRYMPIYQADAVDKGFPE
ncbi:hypothetical protein Pla123a_31240 [Posidoniimonas polymericola]|uniref:Squalene cyclase C-terminal domain-containing protein n=1 Tax=Posidoniimonas polymericola TaxID=2528002 RepID=A0A5C5YL83_9BACT|nr:terpene cyclase/mutase family protein [Posidoniimonas polymericola]TWT75614.1 hypothetical protein Pla123a_31240 [Posidoniimonas polymericola]